MLQSKIINLSSKLTCILLHNTINAKFDTLDRTNATLIMLIPFNCNNKSSIGLATLKHHSRYSTYRQRFMQDDKTGTISMPKLSSYQ